MPAVAASVVSMKHGHSYRAHIIRPRISMTFPSRVHGMLYDQCAMVFCDFLHVVDHGCSGQSCAIACRQSWRVQNRQTALCPPSQNIFHGSTAPCDSAPCLLPCGPRLWQMHKCNGMPCAGLSKFDAEKKTEDAARTTSCCVTPTVFWYTFWYRAQTI